MNPRINGVPQKIPTRFNIRSVTTCGTPCADLAAYLRSNASRFCVSSARFRSASRRNAVNFLLSYAADDDADDDAARFLLPPPRACFSRASIAAASASSCAFCGAFRSREFLPFAAVLTSSPLCRACRRRVGASGVDVFNAYMVSGRRVSVSVSVSVSRVRPRGVDWRAPR